MIKVKGVHVYTIKNDLGVTLDINIDKLKKIEDPAESEIKSAGWAPVAPHAGIDELVRKTGGCVVMNHCVRERLLPASIIKDRLEKRTLKEERKRGGQISRAEKKEFKDAIISEMLPRAFIKSSYTKVIVHDGLLIVETPSSSCSDGVIESILKTPTEAEMGIVFAFTDISPDAMSSCFNEIARMNGSATIGLGESCSMKGSGSITCNNDDISREQIIAHLDEGYSIVKLSMTTRNYSFAFNDKCIISVISLICDDKGDDDDDDAYASFDAYIAELIDAVIVIKESMTLLSKEHGSSK